MRPDSSLSHSSSGPRAGALLALLALVLAPPPSGAQGFDSPLVQAGRVRLEVLPSLHAFDTRFGLRSKMGELVEEEEPLAFDFIREGMGPSVFPDLEDDEALLGAAIEDPDYRLRLGSIRATWDAYSTRIPVRVDAGITDWLTVGATVPFERRRVDADLRVASGGANVGESPLITDPGAPSAFLNEFRAGLQATDEAIQGLCAEIGEGSPECRDAREFLNGANRTFEGLEDAYSGSEFFHLDGSPGGNAVGRRIENIQSRMGELGVDAFTSPPPLATEVFGGADPREFTSRFILPIYGDDGLPLTGRQGFWALGDIELSAHFRLVEAAGADTLEGGRPGFRARAAAGVVVRLATATRDTLRDFLDLDAQRGTNDVELHLLGDLDWPAARIGARLQLLYGTQGSVQLRRRIAGPEEALRPGAPTGIVSWTPGAYTGLAFQPRLFLTPELAVGGSYRYYSRAGAEYSLVGLEGEVDPSEVDVSVLEEETRATVHHVGVRLVFSTVEATRTRRAPLPFEVEARWEKAVEGSGGRTPQGSRFAAGLRVYYNLWGGL